MKLNKSIYTIIIAVLAFFAYNTFNEVKAEPSAVTDDSTININANKIIPEATTTTNSDIKELKIEPQTPAATETKEVVTPEITDIKNIETPVVTEVKKPEEVPSVTEVKPDETQATTTEEQIKENNTTVIEEKEVSPFDKPVTENKTTNTINITPIRIEDIQPAILKEIAPQEEETQTTTVKEQVQENNTTDIQNKTTDTVKLEPTNTTEQQTEEKKVIEQKKELPNLEEIVLPQVAPKAFNNDPVKIEVVSQRIPVGTVIPVKLESAINSVSSTMGDQFNATLTSDIMLEDNIILPAGSVIRGTVGKIRKANLCVKEAKIMLIFDHIVTPAGKQIPVYAYLSGNAKVNYEGYVTGGTSYGKAFKADAKRGKDIMINSTTFGVDKGLAYLAGIPVVITAPVCAIGGALGGGGYIVGKSVYNLFAKGGEVILNQGTKLTITLSKPLDIPLN